MKITRLPASFYAGKNVLQIARNLLGKVAVSEVGGEFTSGRIVETEAYAGTTDKASHAFGGRRGKKNEHMYHRAGTLYVYICYGVHPMFNIVTNEEEIPDAVLLRAIEPLQGIGIMEERTGKSGRILTNGPGKLAKALGLEKHHSGLYLPEDSIYIADDGFAVSEASVETSPRIGVASAGEDAFKPYRFFVKGNPFVSGRNYQLKK